MKPLTVAVVGATGAVGKEIFEILQQRKFPIKEMIPFASSRSEGKSVTFAGRSSPCRVLKKGCFKGIDLVFLDASDAVSKEWVPEAAESGAWVVDNSATYRLDPEVFLLVPEVNGHLLKQKIKNKKELTSKDRIVAGPNCTVAPMVVAFKPILERWGIKRVVLSTYQSTSGAGTLAMDELKTQSQQFLEGQSFKSTQFTHQIAFNCIPHIGGFKDDDYTSEEHKTIFETRKILGVPNLLLTVTAVRVPTLRCHAEAINIECEKDLDINEVKEALRAMPGIRLIDDPKKALYPMQLTSEGDLVEGATGRDPVYVGRVRRDPTVKNGVNLWVVSDNLRKGAALNAVQIAEVLLESNAF